MKRIFLLLCLSTAVHAQSPDTLNRFDYTLPLPAGWTVKEGCSETDCSILAPQDHKQDTFLENINITIAAAPSKNYPVGKYTDFSVNYLPSVIQDFKILERTKLKGNAEYLVYQGTKSNFAQTWKQYYFIREEKLYILTLTAEQTQYASYLERIGPLLDAFSVH
jgi:hypothetical protein